MTSSHKQKSKPCGIDNWLRLLMIYMFCWPSWRHHMETFSSLLAICEAKPPVDSPHKGQWGGSLMVFFVLRLNKRLSKEPRRWWFETPSVALWRHCNAFSTMMTLHPSAASSSCECLKSQMKTLNKKFPLNIGSKLDWCWTSRYQEPWWPVTPGSRSIQDQNWKILYIQIWILSQNPIWTHGHEF